ncbi:MAG TPA: hypothetical protein VK488_02470 [Gaiellaceae bacterium]|nr:hypothetical protein [Gaiellaceae bacterium]
MALRDVASVFGRYFVVGFFLPSFFSLFVLAHSLTSDLLPNVYERHSEGAQVLIVGGAALLVGLMAAGARNLVELFLSGVFLMPRPGSPIARFIQPFTWLVMLPSRRTFSRLVKARDASQDQARQTQLAWHLDRRYPQQSDALMPTAYGNTNKATPNYAWSRWRLDMDAIEDHILALMSDGERALYEEARTDLAFFVNGTLGALAVFGTLVADEILNHPHSARFAWAYALMLLTVALLYRQAVAALDRLGRRKRASIDLHRLELYQKLGLRLPRSFAEEHEIARAINRCLLWGWPLPEKFSSARAKAPTPADRGAAG